MCYIQCVYNFVVIVISVVTVIKIGTTSAVFKKNQMQQSPWLWASL